MEKISRAYLEFFLGLAFIFLAAALCSVSIEPDLWNPMVRHIAAVAVIIWTIMRLGVELL